MTNSLNVTVEEDVVFVTVCAGTNETAGQVSTNASAGGAE